MFQAPLNHKGPQGVGEVQLRVALQLVPSSQHPATPSHSKPFHPSDGVSLDEFIDGILKCGLVAHHAQDISMIRVQTNRKIGLPWQHVAQRMQIFLAQDVLVQMEVFV